MIRMMEGKARNHANTSILKARNAYFNNENLLKSKGKQKLRDETKKEKKIISHK